MTKNNAMLGGGPGGLFAAVLAVLAGGIPYDQLPGVRFLPCFPPYPRAGVCSFIVYGRYNPADSLGSLAENQRRRWPGICGVVACIAYPLVSPAVVCA